jgi:hypothetical protein
MAIWVVGEIDGPRCGVADRRAAGGAGAINLAVFEQLSRMLINNH